MSNYRLTAKSCELKSDPSMLSSIRKPPPQVTGISPKESPPGTRVTIRGENLGVDPRDLIGLRICGVDCLLSAEWKSANKIVARTGQAKGKGDIIVVTRSGGVGSSTVQFRVYNIQIGPLQDSAIWIDESQTTYGRNRTSTPMVTQDHDDPLGISDESNDTKFSEAKLQEMFPDGCGNTSQEEFVPAWFLLENHHGTSFEDLKAGLQHLKRRSGQRSEGPREFLKTNLTTFLDCYDIMTDMNKKMLNDKSAMEENYITDPLEDVLKKSNSAADKLFHDVLSRKDTADATRNTLGVLQRFKFLFNLPLTIDRNIKKGDYDLVITDYTRARSLFGESEVQVFRKVYAEVENRIAQFREMLYKKLMELPSTVDEQKKLIRYLAHLETPGDPAWECLENMQKWLINLLQNCKTENLHRDEEREVEIVVTSPLTPTRLSAPSMTERRQTNTKAGKTPQKVLFVDHLTRILTESLPDLWRLGQTYLSGKLLKGVGKQRVDSTKHGKFNQMVLQIIDLFSKLVRAAFLPHSLQQLEPSKREGYGVWKENKRDSPTGWLPICVRCVRACMLFLTPLDLPGDSMEMLQDLAFDMRTNCMGILLKQAIDDIKKLHEKETWSVDADDERGGTTILPALFENIVSETLQHLQEVVHAKPGEMQLFGENETMIKQETADLCIKVLQSFSGTLEQLAILGNVEKNTTKGRRSTLSPDAYAGGSENMPSLDKRLIVMMSNCNHTREHIITRLVESLERHGYPETAKVQSAASYCYQSLDERLFDNYIEEKANPIIGLLEQNMYAGGYDWAKCPPPKGVKLYAKEALLGIIQVHSEVYSISPSFVPRVMYRLIEYVMDEISRLYQCVPEFNENGALQGRIEILALDSALGRYKNEETCAALREALNYIPESQSKEDQRLVEDCLSKFKTQMRFHLMCFQNSRSRKN